MNLMHNLNDVFKNAVIAKCTTTPSSKRADAEHKIRKLSFKKSSACLVLF